MITRANKLLLLLAGLLLLGSCNKVTYVYSDSYIMYYAIHDGIEIWTNKNKLGQHLLEVRLKKPFKSVSYDSKGEDKIIYDDLCKKHNDLSYCREVPFFNGVGGAIASYPDYTSVSITSNSNYDEEHPAGTPLNDIIICEYCSSYLYVLGGYADESLLGTKIKPLIEVTPEDLMLQARLVFFFTQNPDTPGRHDITVSVTTDDGRTFTATCTMDFNEENLKNLDNFSYDNYRK
ncbi:MAG: hypothetical protein GX899_02780 [Rikenellaceae bacterium]|jgi:hypothetical protein|nr:hypothetical protein [Rikenellaceae bacterium]